MTVLLDPDQSPGTTRTLLTEGGLVRRTVLEGGFLTYLLTEGQDIAEDNDFAPLPETLRTKALAQLEKIS